MLIGISPVADQNHVIRPWWLWLHPTFGELEINRNSSQRLVLLSPWTSLLSSSSSSPTSLPTALFVVSPCTSVIKLSVSQIAMRPKKKKMFLSVWNLLTGRSCGFVPEQLSLNWGLLSEAGSFLWFYLFFKLILEFLNKVGASDLFSQQLWNLFLPPQLVLQKQCIGKIKGKKKTRKDKYKILSAFWMLDYPEALWSRVWAYCMVKIRFNWKIFLCVFIWILSIPEVHKVL